MNKLFLLIFLVSLFLLFNTNCKKKEVPFIKLDPVFLSYFSFPEGSWWTYKEITTEKTDSFFAGNITIKENYYTDEGFRYESMEFTLRRIFDSIKKDGFREEARPVYTAQTPIDSIKFGLFYPFTYSDEDGDGYLPLFFYKITNGQHIINNENIYLKHLDSIQLQGKMYYDVYYTKHEGQSYKSWVNFKSEYYCRNVGVIKREYFDGTVWELTNYHINK